jgi:hypothetical protein
MIVVQVGCASVAPANQTKQAAEQIVAENTKLVGVWKPVEIVVAPNATAHAGDKGGPAGPGLWLFTKHHYAVLDVHTTGPRPPLPQQPTAEDLMATWGPFGANAGTYQVAGGIITMQPSVAKNPQTMTPGRNVTLSYRVNGDTLWLWGLNGRLTEVVKHVRVE